MSEQIRAGEEVSRIPTGIKDLDSLLSGGIPSSHTTIISGGKGTMKTSLALKIAFNQVKNKKHNVLFISINQSFASIINQMNSLSFNMMDVSTIHIKDLKEFEKYINKINVYSDVGSLIVVDFDCLNKIVENSKDSSETNAWINIIKNLVKKIKLEVHLETIMIDGIDSVIELSQYNRPYKHILEIKNLT